VITRKTPLADLPEFLTVDEVADWLALGRGLVYALVRSGELPSVKFGTKVIRVPREALAELVKVRVAS
jgi:excisionase family DNA binding protein